MSNGNPTILPLWGSHGSWKYLSDVLAGCGRLTEYSFSDSPAGPQPSRLGMQMFGCDLNPIAWFVVKNEMAQVDMGEVKRLLGEC